MIFYSLFIISKDHLALERILEEIYYYPKKKQINELWPYVKLTQIKEPKIV